MPFPLVPTGFFGSRTPPTIPAPVETNWSVTGPGTKTMAQTWSTGDVVVVMAVTADQAGTVATPTVAGLTFAAVGTAVTTGSSCWAHKWSATAASGGSGNISCTASGGVLPWGAASWVVPAATTEGIGNNVNPAAGTIQTASLTTAQDHSAVLELIGDWGAGSITGRTWTPSGQTEFEASTVGGQYTVYGATWADIATAATTSYGVSVTASGQVYTKIAVEVLGIAGTGDVSADATLAAVATITAGAVQTDVVDATLAAVATIGGTAAVTRPANATLTGTATIGGTAAVTRPATATLAAVATITPGAQLTVGVAATLTGTATITATAQGTLLAEATVSAVATITTTAATSGAITADATLGAVATITSTVAVTRPAAATLAAVGTITSGAFAVRPAAATVSAVGTLVAGATRSLPGAAAVAAVATITAGAQTTAVAGATLAVLATITTTGLTGLLANLNAVATITATTLVTRFIAATVAANATIAAGLGLTARPTATLTITATILPGADLVSLIPPGGTISTGERDLPGLDISVRALPRLGTAGRTVAGMSITSRTDATLTEGGDP